MTSAAIALPRPDSRDAGIRRYYSLGAFAMLSGTPYQQLLDWRWSERVWVPSADIEVGRWSGWSLACIRAWSPDGSPFLRPPLVSFADAAEVRRRHRVARDRLWTRIYDGTIAGPVVWVDDRPGWHR
ncbi:hypothetical protein [Nocardia sp. NPDC058633]|uniref:hypothetical protein n=1 Tax=Nocardia sp. NPDC058633 TaxID=3346568 RepID=UPI0036529186